MKKLILLILLACSTGVYAQVNCSQLSEIADDNYTELEALTLKVSVLTFILHPLKLVKKIKCSLYLKILLLLITPLITKDNSGFMLSTPTRTM